MNKYANIRIREQNTGLIRAFNTTKGLVLRTNPYNVMYELTKFIDVVIVHDNAIASNVAK